jgi:hypothetical protein
LVTSQDLSRQPVSPNDAIDVSAPLTTGNGELSVPVITMVADFASTGSGSSHTRTGKVASGWARTFITRWVSSTVIAGQCEAPATTARATAPCGPSTT